MNARGPGPRLALLEWGQGDRAVILLHGIGGGRAIWSDSLSGLGASLARAGYHVWAPDFPGYGGSPALAAWTLAGVAKSVLELMEGLGVKRALLVGHSMGGMVAQEMLASAPHAVAGVVLSATSAAFGRADGAWQRDFLVQRLAPLDAGGGMAALAPALVDSMLASGTEPALRQGAVQVMSAVPEATYRAALQALMSFDRRAELASIAVPTLCLAGSLDAQAPARLMQQMAERIAGAEYLCLAGAGHLAALEAAPAFNAAVADFFARRCTDELPKGQDGDEH